MQHVVRPAEPQQDGEIRRVSLMRRGVILQGVLKKAGAITAVAHFLRLGAVCHL
jgi:hypothetical protein